MKKTLLSICLMMALFFNAQDSTKVFQHELGFNAVGLIKQIISNNPSSTLSQLPYQIIYSLNKDKMGIRTGVGVFMGSSKTELNGQTEPRTNNNLSLNSRLGFSYNFLNANKFVFNAFADGLFNYNTSKTVNSFTTTQFPTSTVTTKTTSEDLTTGIGGEIGFGIKYNFTKHLSLYTETPLQFVSSNTKSTVKVEKSGTLTQTTDKFYNQGVSIFLPTTLFLILRF